MDIIKKKTDNIFIKDKLIDILSIDKNDVIRDYLSSDKIDKITYLYTNVIYSYTTPIGKLYASVDYPLKANKHTVLSEDIQLEYNLTVGDYICIGENDFELNIYNPIKFNLKNYLVNGKDVRSIDPSLLKQIGIPLPVLLTALRYGLPEDNKYYNQLEYFIKTNEFNSISDLFEYVINTFSYKLDNSIITINKVLLDLSFLYFNNAYYLKDERVYLELGVITISNILPFLTEFNIHYELINDSYLKIDSLFFYKMFKDSLQNNYFLTNLNSKLTLYFLDLINQYKFKSFIGNEQSLANLQYLLYKNKILSYIDCDQDNNLILHIVEDYVYLPHHGFLIPVLDVQKEDPSLFHIIHTKE